MERRKGSGRSLSRQPLCLACCVLKTCRDCGKQLGNLTNRFTVNPFFTVAPRDMGNQNDWTKTVPPGGKTTVKIIGILRNELNSSSKIGGGTNKSIITQWFKKNIKSDPDSTRWSGTEVLTPNGEGEAKRCPSGKERDEKNPIVVSTNSKVVSNRYTILLHGRVGNHLFDHFVEEDFEKIQKFVVHFCYFCSISVQILIYSI